MRRNCKDLDALSYLRGATLRTLLEEHGEKGVAGCSKREALQRIADSRKMRQIVTTGLLVLAELEHAHRSDDSSSDSSDESDAEDAAAPAKPPRKRRAPAPAA